MTTFQKIIKYGAIAFGIYLCLMIISGIIFALTAIFGITVGLDAYNNHTEINSQNLIEHSIQDYADIEEIEIKLSVCQLDIKKGDKIRVETVDMSDKFECRTSGTTLKIKDDKLNINWFNTNEVVPKVIIYIPEDIIFNSIDIKTGANITNIENLDAKKLELELGVGKYSINNMKAETAKIKAGAGEANILDCEIDTLKLDAGIGKLAITGKITESANIHSGVGKLEMNLAGNKDDYRIKAKTGLGNFIIDGKKVRDNEVVGNGNVNIKIDAGLGETTVNFENQSI